MSCTTSSTICSVSVGYNQRDRRGSHCVPGNRSQNAYLHREEGDLGNAGYWYRRAGIDMPDNTLQEELERLYRLAGDKR